jgi:hypothetical protein
MSIFKTSFIATFLVIVFNGCVPLPFKKADNTNKTTNFKVLTNKLAAFKVCREIDRDSTIYLTDFVNEKDLNNRSQLGFLLSNNLKVSVMRRSCTKNVDIKSFELAQNLKINQSGTKILTRDVNKMKTKSIEDDKKILVGSYIFTQKQLVLFLKLIHLNTGNIISTNTISTPITNEIKDLEGIETNVEPIIYTPFHL